MFLGGREAEHENAKRVLRFVLFCFVLRFVLFCFVLRFHKKGIGQINQPPRSTAKCNISMLWLGWLDRQHLALRSRNGDSSELKQKRNILSCPRATVT